jgi:hypothetical protein
VSSSSTKPPADSAAPAHAPIAALSAGRPTVTSVAFALTVAHRLYCWTPTHRSIYSRCLLACNLQHATNAIESGSHQSRIDLEQCTCQHATTFVHVSRQSTHRRQRHGTPQCGTRHGVPQ